MSSPAFNADPIIVNFTVTDSSGNPSTPTGTMRAWGVLSNRLVEATGITQTGNVVSCNFAGSLSSKGTWTVYLEETVIGTAPNIIGTTPVPVKFAVRP